MTLPAAIRQKAMGVSSAELIQEHQLKFEKKQSVGRQEDQSIYQQIRLWQNALRPQTEQLYFYTHDEGIKKYLREAIAILASHFMEREDVAVDRDLSAKAKQFFPSLTSGEGNSHYQQQLENFLEESLREKDPMIVWLLLFRNPVLSEVLQRSIEEDPERFIDLEKLFIHQLSKFGLLEPKGEKPILFRKKTSNDDKILVEVLPDVLRAIDKLCDAYPQIEQNNESTDDWRERLNTHFFNIARNAEVLAEFLNPQNIKYQARKSALERFSQLHSGVLTKIEKKIVDLYLRVGLQTRLTTKNLTSWPSLGALTNFLGLRRRGLDRRRMTEINQEFGIHQYGGVYFSKQQIKDLENLPLLQQGFADENISNFIENEGKIPLPVATANIISSNLAYTQARAQNADLIYGVYVDEKKKTLPMFRGYQYLKSWKAKEPNGESIYIVAVKKAEKTSIYEGIEKGALEVSKDPAYSLEESFQFEEAMEYNQKNLGGDPYLQKLHKELAFDLRQVRLTKHDLVSEIIKQHLKKLADYFETRRFYDLRDEETMEQKSDYLAYTANNPLVGLKCSSTAKTVLKYLETFGIKASLLNGIVPYFYEGGMYKNPTVGHEICVALLPNGETLELDFTPPITAQTPQRVKYQMTSLIPLPSEQKLRFDTAFEGKAALEKMTMIKAAMVGSLIGTAFAAAVGPMVPGAGIFPRTGNSSTNEEDKSISSNNKNEPELTTNSQPSIKETESDPAKILAKILEELKALDFSKLPLKEILLSLSLIPIGSVSITAGWKKIERWRLRQSWTGYKTILERYFEPTEQMAAASVIYQMRRNKTFDEVKMRRVKKFLSEFEMAEAVPLLELFLFQVNIEGGSVEKALSQGFEIHNLQRAFDELAQLSVTYTTKDELKNSWWQKLMRSKNSTIEFLHQRGQEVIQQKVNETWGELKPVDEHHPVFQLFCRSLTMLGFVAELKEMLEIDQREHDILDKMKPTLNMELKQDQILSERIYLMRSRLRSDLNEIIWQFERSIENGALEIFDMQELKALRDKFYKT